MEKLFWILKLFKIFSLDSCKWKIYMDCWAESKWAFKVWSCTALLPSLWCTYITASVPHQQIFYFSLLCLFSGSNWADDLESTKPRLLKVCSEHTTGSKQSRDKRFLHEWVRPDRLIPAKLQAVEPTQAFCLLFSSGTQTSWNNWLCSRKLYLSPVCTLTCKYMLRKLLELYSSMEAHLLSGNRVLHIHFTHRSICIIRNVVFFFFYIFENLNYILKPQTAYQWLLKASPMTPCFRLQGSKATWLYPSLIYSLW